uniref:Uncharacterized protein n=1 Tax=Cyprinus carpio TaxID=7962 RepID=A0A8C1XKH9_CYPCA
PICACGCEQRACCGDGPDLRNVLVTSVLNLDSYRGHITGFGGQIVGQALVAVSDHLCAPSLFCYFVRAGQFSNYIKSFSFFLKKRVSLHNRRLQFQDHKCGPYIYYYYYYYYLCMY